MAVPIFKSRSYVFATDLPESVRAELSRLGSRLGYRLVEFQNQSELKANLPKSEHVLAIVTAKPGEFASEQGDGRLVLNAQAQTSAVVADFLKGTRQKAHLGFIKLAEFGISESFPNFGPFKHLNKVSEIELIPAPDMMVYCDAVENSLFIRSVSEVNLSQIGSSRRFEGIPQDKIVDLLKECTNQLLGVITFNLRKLGVDCRIGLPAFCDLRVAEGPKFSNFFWGATFGFADLNGLTIRLGYVDINSMPIPDFADMVLGAPSSEVEFL